MIGRARPRAQIARARTPSLRAPRPKVMAAMLGVLLSMAIYMQEALGFGALKTGLLFLPATVPIALLGPPSARLSERFGASPLVAVGVLFLAASGGVETQVTASTDYGVIVAVMVLLGIGVGLIGAPIDAREPVERLQRLIDASGAQLVVAANNSDLPPSWRSPRRARRCNSSWTPCGSTCCRY